MMWLGETQGLTAFAIYPYVALVPGILAGMLINFSLSKAWVFRT